MKFFALSIGIIIATLGVFAYVQAPVSNINEIVSVSDQEVQVVPGAEYHMQSYTCDAHVLLNVFEARSDDSVVSVELRAQDDLLIQETIPQFSGEQGVFYEGYGIHLRFDGDDALVSYAGTSYRCTHTTQEEEATKSF